MSQVKQILRPYHQGKGIKTIVRTLSVSKNTVKDYIQKAKSSNLLMEVLLQAEAKDRTHRRFECLKKNAQFRYQASVEELGMDSSRGINKTQITELTSGSYLKKGQSILLTGATGCGKSSLA